jgi:hypothetical protein
VKACPNPNCSHTEPPRLAIWADRLTRAIRCPCCRLRGPWADNDVDAVVLWDALPRQEDADRLYDALGKIVIWADAYPPDVFPPYSDQSLAELNVLLTAHGYSLDALGAQIMRHVVEGVGDIARKALEVNDG